jgi:hypothetical protein
MMTIVYAVVGWLHVVTTLAALVVCLLHVGRSVWARVLAGAFLLQLLVSLFYQVISLLSRNGMTTSSVMAVYAFASVVGLLGSIAMVAGLAGAFAQIAGMSAPDREAPRSPRPAPSPVEPA